MFTLKIENEYHSQLELTHHENDWQITRITGLNPPNAIISSSVSPSFDGERFNSSRLDKRNIVIMFVVNGNAEMNLMRLNSVIYAKRFMKVYYKTSYRNLYIDGYVESFEYDKFSNKVACQLSIICVDPYWKDVDLTESKFEPVVDLFEYPFSIPEEGIALSELIGIPDNPILNYGNATTGCIIEIDAAASIVEPKIMNVSTGESMTLSVEMNYGDKIVINTNKGQKSITSYCDCKETNLINKLTQDSKWIQLIAGQNRLTYSAAYGMENLNLTVKHRNLYGGV